MNSCDSLFITSDKTEGGIQRALIDWASVILESTPYRFTAITPDNRFSRWLADYHPRAERTLLTSGGRIIMRHLPPLFRYSAAGKRANIAFVHNGFACAAARTLAQHVIGICHNDKPAHFSAADQLICLTPKVSCLQNSKAGQMTGLSCYHIIMTVDMTTRLYLKLIHRYG